MKHGKRVRRKIRKILRNQMAAAVKAVAADTSFQGDWKDAECAIWERFYEGCEDSQPSLLKYAPRVDAYSCPRHASKVCSQILRAKNLTIPR